MKYNSITVRTAGYYFCFSHLFIIHYWGKQCVFSQAVSLDLKETVTGTYHAGELKGTIEKTKKLRDAKVAQVFIMRVCSKYHFLELWNFLTWHMVIIKLEVMIFIISIYIHKTLYPYYFVDTLFWSDYQPNS